MDPAGSKLVSEGFLPLVLQPVGAALGIDRPELRMPLVASQVMGRRTSGRCARRGRRRPGQPAHGVADDRDDAAVAALAGAVDAGWKLQQSRRPPRQGGKNGGPGKGRPAPGAN